MLLNIASDGLPVSPPADLDKTTSPEGHYHSSFGAFDRITLQSSTNRVHSVLMECKILAFPFYLGSLRASCLCCLNSWDSKFVLTLAAAVDKTKQILRGRQSGNRVSKVKNELWNSTSKSKNKTVRQPLNLKLQFHKSVGRASAGQGGIVITAVTLLKCHWLRHWISCPLQ